MKFSDIKNRLNEMFVGGKYELDFKIKENEAEVITNYYGRQKQKIKWWDVSNWAKVLDDILFISNLNWLGNSNSLSSIIEIKPIDNVVRLDAASFKTLETWFANINTKYQTFLPLIKSIDTPVYDWADLCIKLNDDIKLNDIRLLLDRINNLNEELAMMFSQSNNSFIKFKGFDVGSNWLNVGIDIGVAVVAGVIVEAIKYGIVKIVKCVKDHKAKKELVNNKGIKSLKASDEINQIVFDELVDQKGMTKEKVIKILNSDCDKKTLEAIYEVRKNILPKSSLQVTDNDLKYCETIRKTIEEIEELASIKPAFVENKVLLNNNKEFQDIKFIDKEVEAILENAKKEKITTKQLDSKSSKK